MAQPSLVVLAAGIGSRFGGVKQLAPVGPRGEAIFDYSARDAVAAGFGSVVLVVRSEIEQAVADHIRMRWPTNLEVTLVCQDQEPSAVRAAAAGRVKPLGTAHAVMTAGPALKGPFAVINADDLYGPTPFVALHDHFASGATDALVAFEVARTVIGIQPVTRALCEADDRGHLRGIEEGDITFTPGGAMVWVGRATGRELVLAGREPVSMNFWGFGLDALGAMREAVERFMGNGPVSSGAEVLLPDVVRSLLSDPERAPFTMLRTSEQCIGVTHGDDLALMRAAVQAPAW